MLTAAPKSRAQLYDRLCAGDVAPDVAEALLDRFEAVGLIDDAELAGMIVRTRFAEKKQTRRAIAHELTRKGIPPAVAAEALEQVDDEAEAEAALEFARGRLRRTASLDRDVRIRRALGALGRKGYSSAVAMRSIRAALAEEADDDAEDLDRLGYDD